MNDIVIKKPAVYSPLQIGLGSFFGGPIAMTYFLWENFRTLDKMPAARNTLAFGFLFIVALLVFTPMLPGELPTIAVQFIYSLVALQMAVTWQLRKDAITHSIRYCFHSNWRVLLFCIPFYFTWLGVCLLAAKIS